MIVIKRFLNIQFLTFLFIFSSAFGQSSKSEASSSTPYQWNRKAFNFFIVSDWGWNGFKHQQEVADEMGVLGEETNPKFIVSCGDNFQLQGVASAQDPLWLVNYENIYRNLSLQVDWYPVLGNHDYKGSTQAEIDYSKISRRWRLEAHYYTFVKKINDSISARFIFLDTPPLVDEYYRGKGYPDVFTQDSAKQMIWLKDVLADSKEQWKLIFGHHPIYSASKTHGNTAEMIRKVKPLMEKYNAQIYFCGHDHDFQHLKDKGGKVDFIVTGTGGEPRPASSDEHSIFSGSVPGFSVISFAGDSIKVDFVDSKGNLVYSMSRTWKP